jgi:nucleotide-sensitive chloride channel 1A
MQLELSDPFAGAEDDEGEDFIEITLVPTASGNDSTPSEIQALFNAVSTCSNLNPDPADGDEDMEDGRIVFEGNVGYEGISGLPGVIRGSSSGDLPPPFPGSGGWITADNVSQYFDADGNWIEENASEPLGGGAGRVRGRDEVEQGADGESEADGEKSNGNGGGDDAEEHKRLRTE